VAPAYNPILAALQGIFDVVFNRLIQFFRPADEIIKFKSVFDGFQQLLRGNNRTLELISQLEDKMSGEYIFDINYIKASLEQLSNEIYRIVSGLNLISENRYTALFSRHIAIQEELNNIIEGKTFHESNRYIIEYDRINTDLSEIVGEKSAVLGEIRERLELPTPEGFTVTTSAYRSFLEYNNLWPQIRTLFREQNFSNRDSTKLYDRKIDALFAGAAIPIDLEKAILKALTAVAKDSNHKPGFAVRSSAHGEDEEGMSYAGQFLSVMNCPFNEVPAAYTKVVGSRFKYSAMVYDESNALNESALPMAVAVQPMIPSRAAGVLYTVDVTGNNIDCMTLSAAYGLGAGIVSGSVSSDYFRISKLAPGTIKQKRIGKKERKLVTDETGGIKSVPVEGNLQDRDCLNSADIVSLSEKALLLERYFKRALDIEWCVDDEGVVCILQCRPLIIPPRKTIDTSNLRSILSDKPALMCNQGIVAHRGIAAGKVWHVDEEDDPATFPAQAIAVTESSSPKLASIIRRTSAIITNLGSSTGHLATVAREYGVPMIVDTKNATQLLSNGDEITVDAEENIIYRGIIKELLAYEAEREDVFRDLEEYKILRRLLGKISRLNLIDPNDASFNIKNCKTYHDIIRFSHENAVKELIDLNISSRRFRGVKSRKVRLPIPLGLYVIDLGGGLDENSSGDSIESMNQFRSIPMKAVLKGMMTPGVWSTQPMQFGLDDFVSSVTRFSITHNANEYRGQNLAVLSECYCNINFRLGYHFNVIDAYVSENTDDNYVYFRFVGGVTESKRRQLRAILLKRILEDMGFKVTVSSDLVIARLKRLEVERTVKILESLGKLIGFSRQLDTQMQSEASVESYFNEFRKIQ
jgi:pyruvate,water dikinase